MKTERDKMINKYKRTVKPATITAVFKLASCRIHAKIIVLNL